MLNRFKPIASESLYFYVYSIEIWHFQECTFKHAYTYVCMNYSAII